MSGEERAHLEVYEGRDGEWYWRLRAANGEPVASGEGYVSKAGALEGIRATAHALVEALDLASDVKGLLEEALEGAEIEGAD